VEKKEEEMKQFNISNLKSYFAYFQVQHSKSYTVFC